jgi:hypothetical protein
MSLSDYAENKVLEHVVGKTAFTMPATPYMALFSVNPTDGSQTELTGIGYARVLVPGSSWGTAASGEIATIADVKFPAASSPWTVHGWGFYDAETNGNLLTWGLITDAAGVETSVTVNAGSALVFSAVGSTVKVRIDAGETTPPPVVGDYYVSKSGSDANSGAQASPWLTIQHAADTVPAGSSVVVSAGTYDERVTLVASKSGALGAETRFTANGTVVVSQGFAVQSAYTILDGFTITPGSTNVANYDYRGQVYVQAAHVTLRHLDVHDTTNAAAICLGCSAPVADYATIEDCSFTDIPWSAVSVDNGGAGTHAAHVTISRCTVRRFGGHQAIKAYGDYWTVEDTIIQGPALTDFQQATVWDGDGIDLNYATGSIIRRCTIYDIWSHKGYDSGEHADCIQFWASVVNLLIDSCVLGSWKPGGYDDSPGATNAIMYGTCTTNCDVTVQNCLLLCGITAGPSAASNAHLGAAAANSPYTVTIRLYNNTFFGNYPYNNGTNTNLISRNNVFYSHRGSATSGDDSDYNAFLWNQWSDASYTGLQNSTIWTSEGSHSLGLTEGTKLVAADIFTRPDVVANTDYGLTADFAPIIGSALLGAGDPAHAPALDIEGATRSLTAPTIGAYEVAHSAVVVNSLSATHTSIGAQLTISGGGFGAVQGTSKVWFGELPIQRTTGQIITFGDGALARPVTKEGTVTNWTSTSITVTVPSMSPGLAGAPNTYHPVYVEVGGVCSNRLDFYMDPLVTLDGSSSATTLRSYFPNVPASGVTFGTVTYNNTSDSRYPSQHASYTTQVTLDSTNGAVPGNGCVLVRDVHDVLFKDITFRNTSNQGNSCGVLALGYIEEWGMTLFGRQYNLTFHNCVIDNNMNSQPAGEGWNGIKAFNGPDFSGNYSRVGDWTFSDCSIGRPNSPAGSFGRFAMEFNEDTLVNAQEGACLQYVKFVGCDWEPSGAQATSFVMNSRATAGPDRHLFYDNCTFKGWAANGTSPYGPAYFEFHNKGMVVRDCKLWAGGAPILNARGDWSGSTTPHQHILFKHTDLMTNTVFASGDQGLNSSWPWGMMHARSRGTIFDDCDFDFGVQARCYDNGGGTNAGYGEPGWETVMDCDFSTSYFHGYCRRQVDDGCYPPDHGSDYWSYGQGGVSNPLTYYAGTNTTWPHVGTRP